MGGLTATALAVLADPAAYRPGAGAGGRALVEERYSLEVAIPELQDYFERAAGRARAAVPSASPGRL